MAANPLPQQLADLAESIVNSLAQTDYQHHEVIDADAGVFECDCSGFVGYVLDRLAPRHYAALPVESTQPRPRAFEYCNFFSTLAGAPANGWLPIQRLADARRGDILAWRFAKVQAGHDTGHVVFLAETPADGPSGVVSVRVYDSANAPHFEDTRGSGDGQFPNGVGTGFLNFHVDSTGRPTAFQFAPGDSFVTLPIAIGRTEPFGSGS